MPRGVVTTEFLVVWHPYLTLSLLCWVQRVCVTVYSSDDGGGGGSEELVVMCWRGATAELSFPT